MTAGLPGTGIGGIFYLLLALYMPVCECFRTLKGQSTLKRWGFITLQLSFVGGILTAMSGEVWLLNHTILWFQEAFHLNIGPTDGHFAFINSRQMATASAMGSFISLAFVSAIVSVLRICVSRPKNTAICPAAA